MPWAAAAAVVGSVIGADATRSASNKAVDATDRATDEQRRQYDLYRQDQAPYRDIGYQSLDKLGELLGLSGDPKSDQYGSLLTPFTGDDLANDPGYQFRLKQGQDLRENSAAARGGLFSGATGKAMEEYGQDFASNEFQNAWMRNKSEKDTLFNRYSGLAGTGQTATQSVGAAGQNFANQYGSNVIGGANAQAAAGMAQGNLFGGAINQIGAIGARGGFGGFGGSDYTSPNFFGNYSNPAGSTYDYTGGNLYGSAGDYSDEALKEDVQRIATRPDGLGVYAFRYLWESTRRIGLMAQEVERVYPHAVSRDAFGFRKVDYARVH